MVFSPRSVTGLCRARTDRVPPKQRLDLALVQLGLAPTRERARALILAGQVTVDGHVVSKAGAPVTAGPRRALAPPRPPPTPPRRRPPARPPPPRRPGPRPRPPPA